MIGRFLWTSFLKTCRVALAAAFIASLATWFIAGDEFFHEATSSCARMASEARDAATDLRLRALKHELDGDKKRCAQLREHAGRIGEQISVAEKKQAEPSPQPDSPIEEAQGATESQPEGDATDDK